jgi:hypothetical protein
MINKIDTLIKNAQGYFDRYARREFTAWLLISRFYAFLLPIIIILIVSVVIFVNPFAPKTAYLAIGQTGSSYGIIGEKFQEIFLRYGIDLQLINTDGLAEGLVNLDDPQSIVNASFITAGSFAVKDYPALVSLGSIQFAPIWIFYRGKKLNIDDPFDYFSKRKIGIGKPETNSNKIFRRALLENQQDATNSKGLLEYSYLESAESSKRVSWMRFLLLIVLMAPLFSHCYKTRQFMC